MKNFLLTALVLFNFCSCTMIPEMDKLKSPVSKTLTRAQGPGVEIVEKQNYHPLNWREFYQLKELQFYIDQSLKNNRDLRVAALNVQEVRSLYNIQRSQLLPDVTAGGSLNRRRIPENGFIGFGGGGVGGRTSEGITVEQYSLEVGITSYELDLFGRVRSLNQAALQEYFASEAAKNAVRVSLISEVATTYLRLLADKALEDLAIRTAKTQEESVQIVKRRFTAGISSQLELNQAQTLLESARADAIAFERQVALDQNALNLLIGTEERPPQVRASFGETMKLIKELPVSLDSSVLLNRPDIRQAEHVLLSANADIGAARAAFFPSLSLTTSVGKLSTELSTILAPESNTWLFLPQLNLPIFTGGRNKAQLNLAKVRKDLRIAEYERAIQVAFREASDALISNEKLFELLEAQRKVMESASKTHAISRARYKSGIESYLVELDSIRALYQAERTYINQQLEYLSNLSFLYRALGGGVE